MWPVTLALTFILNDLQMTLKHPLSYMTCKPSSEASGQAQNFRSLINQSGKSVQQVSKCRVRSPLHVSPCCTHFFECVAMVTAVAQRHVKRPFSGVTISSKLSGIVKGPQKQVCSRYIYNLPLDGISIPPSLHRHIDFARGMKVKVTGEVKGHRLDMLHNHTKCSHLIHVSTSLVVPIWEVA